jgi:nucleoside-diphosphate-sugar epimerase
MHGGELAMRIATAMEQPGALNEDFNLSTPVSTTVLELAELVWHKTKGAGVTFHYVSDHPSSTTWSGEYLPPRGRNGCSVSRRRRRSTRCWTR